MALADLQAFFVERLQAFDSTIDVSSGSPIDAKVIQPLLRRLGSDPYSVDIGTFIQTTLNQQFPDMPTREGDAITDLLIKAAVVLWNPIIRETTRVANSMSFKDPTTLTSEEAEALGANLFATRDPGAKARGTGRLYFGQPQSVSVNPSNFFTSRGDLHYFPDTIQSIRMQEMLLNVEGSLYYFDVSLLAENPGDAYNIEPDELITVANITGAVRVTNKVRFRDGTPEEDAVTFIGRAEQDLTERSLVTQRGIVAKVIGAFPEVTRLNSAGFNDPEMQRDVLSGGGLGQLLAGGTLGATESDVESAARSRRFLTLDPDVDFTALIGPVGAAPTGFVLTVHGAFGGELPAARDLDVLRVVDAQTLDVTQQVFGLSTGRPWSLRQKTLTIAGIPGGILYPDGPNGTVSIPNDQVHIGGATDIYVRGVAFDDGTLTIEDLVDDRPLLQGVELEVQDTTTLRLSDLVYGTNYGPGDATYAALAAAATENLSIQVLDPPNAGTYRILAVQQFPGTSPLLTVTPVLTVVAGAFRWRVSRELFIDLAEPRETRVAGTDLRTVQGRSVVDTMSGVDFDSYGVAAGDVLRITTGNLITGDYTVQAVLSPLYTKLQLDRKLPASSTGATFTVFRRNPSGGLQAPLVRIKTIDLLDSSSQPVGTTIPYGRAIDVRSSGFANSAHGVKSDVTDARLGLVTQDLTGVSVAGRTLVIEGDGLAAISVTFSNAATTPAAILAQLNAAAPSFARLAVLLDDGKRIGIVPVSSWMRVTGGTARQALFGTTGAITSRDVASDTALQAGGWENLRPRLDADFDVLQVLDGLQIGFYGALAVGAPTSAYDPLQTGKDFSPEVGRHIQVGARSLGTARMFFLDPTSVEVDPATIFTVTQDDGSALRFFPDPTNDYQRIPALPSGTKPTDGVTAASSTTFTSASTDFIAKGIRPGDTVVIDYVPIVGTVALEDPVLSLHARTLIVSMSGGVDKTVTFLHDADAVPTTAVSRQGVVDQINRTIGKVVAALDATYHLKFNPDASLIVRTTGTGNTLLGFSTTADQSNDAPTKGTYVIAAVGPGGDPTKVVTETAFATAVVDQQFKVFRSGLQRLVSTQMSKQLGDAGLYYFDVELVSEGTGDQYNVTADLAMTAENYRADGYYLTVDDPNMTFSPLEKPQLHLSRSILEVGASDDPDSATPLLGQNIQVNYDRSTLVANVDAFSRSESERVVNQSPLARHLIPCFVRFDLSYYGGSKEDVLTADIETFIQNLFPIDYLYVSALERICSNRGARSVDNPIDLVAVIHNVDRTVTVERSQDALGTGRLSAFIPDVLNITRRLA